MRRIALVLVLSALVVSCANDESDGGLTGPQNANVAGTWDALVTVTGGTQGPVEVEVFGDWAQAYRPIHSRTMDSHLENLTNVRGCGYNGDPSDGRKRIG